MVLSKQLVSRGYDVLTVSPLSLKWNIDIYLLIRYQKRKNTTTINNGLPAVNKRTKYFISIRMLNFMKCRVLLANARWFWPHEALIFYNACIYLFHYNKWVWWLSCVDIIEPEAIHKPVAIKVLVSSLLFLQKLQKVVTFWFYFIYIFGGRNLISGHELMLRRCLRVAVVPITFHRHKNVTKKTKHLT